MAVRPVGVDRVQKVMDAVAEMKLELEESLEERVLQQAQFEDTKIALADWKRQAESYKQEAASWEKKFLEIADDQRAKSESEEEEITKLKSEVEKLIKQNEVSQATLDTRDKTLQQTRQLAMKYKQQCSEANAEIQSLKKQVEKLGANRNREETTSRQGSEDKIKRLDRKVDSLESDRRKLESERKELKKSIDRKRSAIKAKDKEIRVGHEEKKILEEKVCRLDSALAEATRMADNYKAQASSTNRAHTPCNNIIKELKAQLKLFMELGQMTNAVEQSEESNYVSLKRPRSQDEKADAQKRPKVQQTSMIKSWLSMPNFAVKNRAKSPGAMLNTSNDRIAVKEKRQAEPTAMINQEIDDNGRKQPNKDQQKSVEDSVAIIKSERVEVTSSTKSAGMNQNGSAITKVVQAMPDLSTYMYVKSLD